MSEAVAEWQRIRAKYLYRVVDERAGVEPLPLLAVSIHHGVVPRDTLTEDEPRAEDLSAYKRCMAGDVVINRMRAFQGAVGVAPQAGIVSPDYVVLRLVEGVNVRYFHHLFRSKWFVGEMTSRLRGIGGVDQGNVRTPRINVEDFGEILVGLPPPAEQRELGEFLDRETARIDAVIEKKLSLLALARTRWRCSVTSTIFELGPPAVRLKRLAAHAPRCAAPAGERPFIALENLESAAGRIARDFPPRPRPPEAAAVTVEIGDVLFGKLRPYLAKVMLVDRPVDASTEFLVLRPSRWIESRWLKYLLLSQPVIDWATATSDGTKMPRTSWDKLGAVLVPEPPDLERQRQLVAALDAESVRVDRLARLTEWQLDRLRERRAALTTAIVTGDLSVAEAAA